MESHADPFLTEPRLQARRTEQRDFHSKNNNDLGKTRILILDEIDRVSSQDLLRLL